MSPISARLVVSRTLVSQCVTIAPLFRGLRHSPCEMTSSYEWLRVIPCKSHVLAARPGLLGLHYGWLPRVSITLPLGEQWLLCRSGDSWRLSRPSSRSCGNHAKTDVGCWQRDVCRLSSSTAANVVKAVQRIDEWDGDGENTNCFLLVSTVHIKRNVRVDSLGPLFARSPRLGTLPSRPLFDRMEH